jgi:hypothetical protein
MAQKLTCTKEFNPVLFIGESWSAAEEDERANALTQIDVGAIALVSCLKIGDHIPTGEECLGRLKEMPNVRLGGRAFLALWENQRLIPDNWKEPFVFVFFDGLILQHHNGNHYSPYLSWDDQEWRWYTGWLGNSRSASSRSAVLE